MISLSHWNLPTTLLLKLLSKLKKQTKTKRKKNADWKAFFIHYKMIRLWKRFYVNSFLWLFCFYVIQVIYILVKAKNVCNPLCTKQKKCVIKVWRAIHFFFHYSHCKNGKTPWKVYYLDIRVFVKMKCHENFRQILLYTTTLLAVFQYKSVYVYNVKKWETSNHLIKSFCHWNCAERDNGTQSIRTSKH